MKTLMLDPDTIKTKDRIRTDLGEVEALAESIRLRGQIHPVRVVPNGKGYELIAGERRRRACKLLGVKVRAEVAEPEDADQDLLRQIDENMQRKDFDILEQAEALARSKRLYEKAHPETKHGAVGRRGPAVVDKVRFADSAKLTPAQRFTLEAAENRGWSERKVQELLELAALPRAQKQRIETAKPAERAKVAQECLAEVRQKRKVAKLEEAAKARQPELVPSGPPIQILEGDNAKLMATLTGYHVILTDPPYGRKRAEVSHTKRKGLNVEIAWDALDVGWVLQAAPCLVLGGHLLVFCPLEAIGDYERACAAAGLEYRQALIWAKTNPAPQHRPGYVSAAEAIVWAVKPGATPHFNPEFQKAGAEAHNVLTGPGVPGSANDRLHPTQKPEWLTTKLLNNHADPKAGHTVLDPFAGSGTTGVSCRQLGLPCTLIEKDPGYVKAAKARLG